MADTPIVKTIRVTRDKLAVIFKSHELVKAFENLQSDVMESIPEAIAASSTDADSVLGSQAFLQRVHMPPTFDDESGKVLASQIFGG